MSSCCPQTLLWPPLLSHQLTKRRSEYFPKLCSWITCDLMYLLSLCLGKDRLCLSQLKLFIIGQVCDTSPSSECLSSLICTQYFELLLEFCDALQAGFLFANTQGTTQLFPVYVACAMTVAFVAISESVPWPFSSLDSTLIARSFTSIIVSCLLMLKSTRN